MTSRHGLLAAAMLGLVLVIAGCSGDESASRLTSPEFSSQMNDATAPVPEREFDLFKGPARPIGHGVAQTWIKLDRNGTPLAVGLTLTDKALEGLPADEPASWVLPFHQKASSTPYMHVLLDYNPHGHEPPGVYDRPHFDVHFYMIPSAERMLIGPDDPGFDVLPGLEYIPDQYMKIPGGVPQMGAHWADLLAPEFTPGGTFTRTYIWGTYNGQVIFFEPMITKAYLESDPSETIPLRQPQAYQKDGYYPMSYRVEYLENPARYEISLQDLVFHEGQ